VILILSSQYDFSVDLVTKRLEELNEEYIRINKEVFHEYEFCLNPLDRSIKIFNEYKEINVNSFKSIWFRQPVFTRVMSGNSVSLEDQLYKSQWSAFLRSFMLFTDAKWINYPQATYLAESKPYQLMIAYKLGFKVPKTMVGNSVENMRDFDDSLVLKSMDTVFLKESHECYFTYTNRFSKDSIKKENIKDVPLTFQEYVADKIDIRVTVIGTSVFAVSITSKGERLELDWRTTPKDSLEYRDVELPEIISNMCVSLVRELGLIYGAIDLVESNGEFYFIEINPTGEWGWLCNKSRQIDRVITEALVHA